MMALRGFESDQGLDENRVLDSAKFYFTQVPHRLSVERDTRRHAPPPTLCPFTFTSIRTQTAVRWNTLLGIFAPGGRFILTKVTGTPASPLWQTTPTLDAHE